MKKGLVLVALMLFASAATARSSVDVTGNASFAEQQKKVLTDLADGETYAEITPENRSRVVEALGRMERLLGGREANALHPDDRAKLINEQEVVNTILTRARSDSRLICSRETPIGSRMATTVCRSVAERRRQQDDSRQRMEAAGRGRANTIL
ncbi:MAG: hypothetical protein GX856_01165 [Gammaproteobacteria bacterium]|jgi:hypothetical protein|nr:hypothetical protein [Gammaproteobacteria bacterium]